MENCNFESDSDSEIIPMKINKKRIIKSDTESSSDENNYYLNKNFNRKRIIRPMLSSDDNSSSDNNASDSAKENNNINTRKNRKTKRNSGQKYYTEIGNIIPAKKFENIQCGCSKNCRTLVNETDRKKQFDIFWSLADFNKQNIFLLKAVQRFNIKRRTKNYKGTQRKCAYKYSLSAPNGKIRVCKNFFVNTFKISVGRLDRVLKSEDDGMDKRGRMPGSSRKISEAQLIHIKEHIQSFPQYESHYTRLHNPNRRYLPPELNVKQMYNLYLERCGENSFCPVSEITYRRVFKKEFNLHFHQPRKDTCQKCDFLNLKIKTSCNNVEITSLREEHDIHLKNAELARKCIQEDKVMTSQNPDRYFAFSFDLQKALPYPKLSVSIAYYKRNMYVLNAGFHNFHDNEVNMYAWDETIASRGAQEIASCCLKHLENLSTQQHVIAYSDMCTGQNRNLKLALMWLKVVQSPKNVLEVIDHKFLFSGHSYLPNDADFGTIESTIRKKDLLYVPKDYYNIIKQCRKNRKFILHEMKQTDFVSTKPLEAAILRRRKNVNGEIVNWLKICWIRVLKSKPYTMFYKTSFNENEEFKSLNLLPSRGRPQIFGNIVLAPLYHHSRSITFEKFADMMDLLPYIPPIYHDYFQKLEHNKKS